MSKYAFFVNCLVSKHGSLRKAAKAVNLTPAYLCRLRSGERTGPSEETLAKIGVPKK